MGGGTTQDDVLEVTNNLRSPPTTSLRRPHGDQNVPLTRSRLLAAELSKGGAQPGRVLLARPTRTGGMIPGPHVHAHCSCSTGLERGVRLCVWQQPAAGPPRAWLPCLALAFVIGKWPGVRSFCCSKAPCHTYSLSMCSSRPRPVAATGLPCCLVRDGPGPVAVDDQLSSMAPRPAIP